MPIATLIAADSFGSGLISEACDRLAAAACEAAEVEWLEPGKAVDIGFSGDVRSARGALAEMEVLADIVVQAGANRRKMLLVSDMDSTMITVECIDELADYAGIKEQIAGVTERAMRGELDFAEALRARVAMLAGLDEGMIERCLKERVKPMPGAVKLVETMAGWGAHCLLVSGGFVQFAESVAAQIGFHAAKANMLGIEGGHLTGEVVGDIVDADAKRAALTLARDADGIDAAGVLALGDGANDIPDDYCRHRGRRVRRSLSR